MVKLGSAEGQALGIKPPRLLGALPVLFEISNRVWQVGRWFHGNDLTPHGQPWESRTHTRRRPLPEPAIEPSPPAGTCSLHAVPVPRGMSSARTSRSQDRQPVRRRASPDHRAAQVILPPHPGRRPVDRHSDTGPPRRRAWRARCGHPRRRAGAAAPGRRGRRSYSGPPSAREPPAAPAYRVLLTWMARPGARALAPSRRSPRARDPGAVPDRGPMTVTRCPLALPLSGSDTRVSSASTSAGLTAGGRSVGKPTADRRPNGA